LSRTTVCGIAIIVVFVSYIAFWSMGLHLLGLVLGVILLDAGVQRKRKSVSRADMRPDARSRVKTNLHDLLFWWRFAGILGNSVGLEPATVEWCLRSGHRFYFFSGADLQTAGLVTCTCSGGTLTGSLLVSTFCARTGTAKLLGNIYALLSSKMECIDIHRKFSF
jgi:hypothetical protein